MQCTIKRFYRKVQVKIILTLLFAISICLFAIYNDVMSHEKSRTHQVAILSKNNHWTSSMQYGAKMAWPHK